MRRCVKCGAPRPEGAVECPQCGIIYARSEQKQAQLQEAARRRQMEEVRRPEQTPPQPEPAVQEGRKKISPVMIGGGIFFVLFFLMILIGSITESSSKKKQAIEERDKMRAWMAAEEQKLKERTKIVSIDPDAFGCHELEDMKAMASIASTGSKAKFKKAMEFTKKHGRCDIIPSRVVTAFFESDPSGYVLIKDYQGALWWVNPSVIEEE